MSDAEKYYNTKWTEHGHGTMSKHKLTSDFCSGGRRFFMMCPGWEEKVVEITFSLQDCQKRIGDSRMQGVNGGILLFVL